MKTRGLELGVGLFLLVGFCALVVLALRVSGLTLGNQENTYDVYANFNNISGLTVRSKVTLAGVIVGKIAAIELDHKTYMGRVTLTIDKQVDNIPVDSTATIFTAGLLGEKYIGLSIGGDDQSLKPGDTIHDTQSALILEELIGKFLMNSVNSNGKK